MLLLLENERYGDRIVDDQCVTLHFVRKGEIVALIKLN